MGLIRDNDEIVQLSEVVVQGAGVLLERADLRALPLQRASR
ncbi:hypothetical protein B840_12505 (plasmid) [Corynebacterium marinum DSM 44953]|uniref:Uncharacterized protein n=1 Tax=Corynebacterium marinum DSM 44953 TaxID=1224162 RepID=A0A0B6TUV4_9CORY|nr:hypothetical protein B840_12505 [Corynebacterium marinum DSM 44953]